MTAFALVARFASSLDASEETTTNGIARLRPKSELSSDCFGFPQENFHRNNCIKCTHGTSPAIPVSVGDAAIDFTLHDLADIPHTLSHMLQDKPVVLIWGMYTCPAYQVRHTLQPAQPSRRGARRALPSFLREGPARAVRSRRWRRARGPGRTCGGLAAASLPPCCGAPPVFGRPLTPSSPLRARLSPTSRFAGYGHDVPV